MDLFSSVMEMQTKVKAFSHTRNAISKSVELDKKSLTKETAKVEIEKLIKKYEKLLSEGRLSQYNEEMTKKDFILPLFRVLGWNTENSEEVTAEERISKGRVDYGFRISNVPKFFLEAKAIKEDLEKPEFVFQAINYAWLKGTTWAVLTDFEGLKIFNSEWKFSNPLQSLFLSLRYDEYLKRFDQLWLLSKESFEQNLLNQEAENWGKKTKRVSVDKQLLLDFTAFRDELSKSITELNKGKKISEDEIDESVQKILDRLVFIRNCEDRELESKILISILREWEDTKKTSLIKHLSKIFKYFDEQYNSKLLEKHLCDDLEIDDKVLSNVIQNLYESKNGTVVYDFSTIEADVFGNIYEQYLGHILKKTKKAIKLTENQLHRKEHGIYYTPTYIVDYIVKNTLGELIKNKKDNIENIKILDMACGSGSFLIKAFDILNDYYKKDKHYRQTNLDFKTGIPFTKKVEILQNNIFGVDLDKQAVEIAQLNLLMKIVERGHRLPMLQKNVIVGNSLIDDENIAGDKALHWEEEFREIIKQGGFDVIIGNPPYVMVENLQSNEREYMMSHFETALKRFDIYIGFIERAIKLLKKGGSLGFIIPYQFLTQDYAEKIREYLLKNCTIKQIVDLSQQKVFEEASVRNIILIVQKGRYKSKTKIVHSNKPNVYSSFGINQDIFDKIPGKKFRTNINEDNIKILEKITLKSFNLGEIALASWGARGVPKEDFQLDKPINNLCKKMIKGRNLYRYNIEYSGKWFLYDIKKLYRTSFPELFENEKLVFRGVVDRKGLVASYDDNKYYTDHSLNCLILKHNLSNKKPSFFGQRKITMTENEINLSKQFNLKFLLGVINSKLINFYFKLYFSDELHVYPETIEQLPVPYVQETQQQPLIKLVDKMLFLNKRLNDLKDKLTDERKKIEEDIKKTDDKINELVYNLYGLTKSEIRIVEESLK